MNESFEDDRYFVNPLNSLSNSENESQLQYKYQQSISDEPFKKTLSKNINIEQEELKIQYTSTTPLINTNTKDVYLRESEKNIPFQSINGISLKNINYNTPTPELKKEQSRVQFYQQDPSQVQPIRLPRTSTINLPKKAKIFDDLNVSVISEKNLFKESKGLKEPQKIMSNQKEIKTVEELLALRSMFMATNFNETNIETFCIRTQNVTNDIAEIQFGYDNILKMRATLTDFRRVFNGTATFIDGTPNKEYQQSVELLETCLTDLMSRKSQETNKSFEVLEQEAFNVFQLRDMLEANMEGLIKVKNDLQLLKYNSYFIKQFYGCVEQLKDAQVQVKEASRCLIDQMMYTVQLWVHQLAEEVKII
ncbi:Thioredoxin- transmembrane protein 2 [Paramecium bursaria]